MRTTCAFILSLMFTLPALAAEPAAPPPWQVAALAAVCL